MEIYEVLNKRNLNAKKRREKKIENESVKSDSSSGSGLKHSSNPSLMRSVSNIRTSSSHAPSHADATLLPLEDKDQDFVIVSVIGHEKEFSEHDVVVNKDALPFVEAGSIIQLYIEDVSVCLVQAKEGCFEAKGSFQISVSLAILKKCKIPVRTEVKLKIVQSDKVAVDFVQLTFKDQFISRSDMWRFKRSCQNVLFSVGKNISALGMKAIVESMQVKDEEIKFGTIGENTKLVFRTRSANIFWLIQLSKEMWDFSDDGQTYFDKTLKFIAEMLVKWKNREANHSLTIILFSRVWFWEPIGRKQFRPPTLVDIDVIDLETRRKLEQDVNTDCVYEDYYKVIVENETRSDWESLLSVIKSAFYSFSKELKLGQPIVKINLNPKKTSSNTKSLKEKHNLRAGHVRVPSLASQGNFLEAVNICLSSFAQFHLDIDVLRTGQNITVLTAGNAVFDVTYNLKRITKTRMMEMGVGCDLISVARPPLHNVPLFRFTDKVLIEKYNSKMSEGFQTAYWLNVTFLSAPKSDSVFDSYYSSSKAMQQKKEEPEGEINSLNTPLSHIYLSKEAEELNHQLSGFEPFPSHLFMWDNEYSSFSESEYEDGKFRIDISPWSMFYERNPLRREELQGFWGNAVEGKSRPLFYHFNQQEASAAADASPIVPLLQGNEYKGKVTNSLLGSTVNVEKIKKQFDEYDASVFEKPTVVFQREERSRSIIEEDMELIEDNEYVKSRSAGNLTRSNGSLTGSNNSLPLSFKRSSITSSKSMANLNSFGINQQQQSIMAASPPLMVLEKQSLTTEHRPRNLNKIDFITPPVTHHLSSSLENTSFMYKAKSGNSSGSSLSSMVSPSVRFNIRSSLSRIDEKKKLTAYLLPSVINPFRKPSDQYIHKISHNRSRWSHIFADGKMKLGYYDEPNWRSLCEPAILPLTTDHIPTGMKLVSDFTEKQYNLLAKDTKDPSIDSRLLLMREMVSQRLAQDFQLVKPDVIKFANSKDTLAFDNVSSFCLSMGHRVHILTFDAEREKTINVIEYNAKPPINHYIDSTDEIEYNFTVWNPLTCSYQSAVQSFFGKDPNGLQWNPMDQYISEDEDSREAPAQLKFKRLLFGILPLSASLGSDIEIEENKMCENVKKFLKSVADRAMKANGKNVEVELTFIKKHSDYLKIDHNSNSVTPRLRRVSSSYGDEASYLAESFDSTQADDNERRMNSINIGNIGYSKDRREWLTFSYETDFNACRCFHFEISWVVSAGCTIVDFLSTLKKKAKQLMLEMVDIPHFVYDEIQNPLPSLAYPLNVATFINCNISVRDMIMNYEFPKLGFCLDYLEYSDVKNSPQPTNVKNVYISSSIGSAEKQIPFKKKICIKRRRQYISRSSLGFIRIIKTGFLWLPNTCRSIRLSSKMDTSSREIYQKLVNSIQSYEICNGIALDIIDGVAS